MTQAEFVMRITREFGFPPTLDQQRAMETFARFLADRGDHVAMILRGSAGTGKTSLAGAMMRTLHGLGQKLMLLAPTGRAAKVFSLNSGLPASTVHRRIYREKSYQGVDGTFNLNNNLYHDMLFVVDEASMVSSLPTSETSFGSGSLLDDLVQFVYSGQNCRLLLIGDTAQLPPVGEEEAPALSDVVLAGYGLRVYSCDLTEVLRQSGDSGILWNATMIRQMITHEEATELPKIRLHGFADIVKVPGNELIESLASSYSRVGLDETIVITRSNKRANIYNQGIRARVLDREEAIESGDMVMVVRNNYRLAPPPNPLPEARSSLGRGSDYRDKQFQVADKTLSAIGKAPYSMGRNYSPSPARNELGGGGKGGEAAPSFLANGDRMRVRRVRHFRDFYGFHFADAQMEMPDYDDYELETTIIMDALNSDAPALTREQNDQLFQQVMADYSDLPTKGERMAAMRKDQYFNALQIKFAYAVTCHKAQGGQWEHVYVDQGYMTDDMLTPDYIHWLYTAFTRATEKLFLVNWPETQIKVSD